MEDLFDLVRHEYSGDSALITTAYVEQRWRLPGNKGFNESIFFVRDILERAGFQQEGDTTTSNRTYRLESRTMSQPTWEPVDASVSILGEEAPLLQFSSNRNMITINSFSTPPGGIEAEVVYVGNCASDAFNNVDLKDKIVFGECSCYTLFKKAVQEGGAAGVLGYRIPGYNQPEKYTQSIPFTSVPLDSVNKAWGINLSYAAKEALKEKLESGPLKINVEIDTRIYQAEELTLVAEIQGAVLPDERFVFSAHVQEPGANDNASGVACLAEMARTAAWLYQSDQLKPARTLTFLWGDEISSTKRFVTEDKERSKGIRWGISLDMVGENTALTGGTFLIEKMPDPSAIWTRGEDRHSEWGATQVKKEDLQPHYFNDFILDICQRQAAISDWVVNTNPFEGGSDHVPFLRADIPGLLLWHFTDAFYHTDADRIDKVSPETLYNVGVSALVSALTLCSADEATTVAILNTCKSAALKRLNTEFQLSQQALTEDGNYNSELDILQTWGWWYDHAIKAIAEIPVEGAGKTLQKDIRKSRKDIQRALKQKVRKVKPKP